MKNAIASLKMQSGPPPRQIGPTAKDGDLTALAAYMPDEPTVHYTLLLAALPSYIHT